MGQGQWFALALVVGWVGCAQGLTPDQVDARLQLRTDALPDSAPMPMPDAMQPPDAPPGPDAQPPDAMAPCLGGQVNPQNGHCYQVFSVAQAWNAAQAACQALVPSEHLATLTSASEHAFVVGLAGTSTDWWIGLTNQANPAVFAWVTGEPLVFTNWAAGEPNHGAGACARLKGLAGGLWADSGCTDLHGYVCERD